MAEDLSSITNKIGDLLKLVNERKIMVAVEFVRSIFGNAFLVINEWLKGGKSFEIGGKLAQIEICCKHKLTGDWSTIYDSKIISKGQYDWKVKITSSIDIDTLKLEILPLELQIECTVWTLGSLVHGFPEQMMEQKIMHLYTSQIK